MTLAHAGVGTLPAHDSLMVVAVALPVLFVVTVLVATALYRRGLLGEIGATIDLRSTLAVICTGLSLGAAAIHFAVLEAHLVDGLLFGLFFLVVGAFQLFWAQAYVLRRTRLVAAVGVAGNALVVGMWVVSRTVGVPLGPTPWLPEPVGLADLTATSLELVMVGLLLPAVVPQRMREFNARRMLARDAAVLAGFSVLTVTLLTGVALLAMPPGA